MIEFRPVFVSEHVKRGKRFLQVFKGENQLVSFPQMQPEPEAVGGFEQTIGVATGPVDAISQRRFFDDCALAFPPGFSVSQIS